MASFDPGKVIKEVRTRKRMKQEWLLHSNSEHDARTVSRVERENETPRETTLNNFLSEVDMEMKDFFCPYLDGASPGVYQMRTQLLDCLDAADDENAAAEAKRIMDKFEQMKIFKKVLNKHFLLSCKARYNEIVKGNPETARKLIRQGIKITYPEFEISRFVDEVLIFEEPELLHTYALMLSRTNDLDTAIKTLTHIRQGLEKLPEDDSEKIKQLAKVLLTLTRCFMQAGDYAQALSVCDAGNAASLKYCRGRYTPDFLHNGAVCLLHLGRLEESKKMFTHAYFGYSLFHKKARAEQVRSEAQAMAGFAINTYGVDALAFAPINYHREYDTEMKAYKNLGEMFRDWRKQAGLTLGELSCGICNRGYLQKIEANAAKQPGVYILEALAERLGRDHSLYFNTFVSAKVFKEKQMRNEIHALLLVHEYEKAEALLAVLEQSKDYKKGINLQFIYNVKATLLSRGVSRGEEYFKLIDKAIKITIPKFDEKDIERLPLTHMEKLLINKFAIYHASNGDLPRAVKIMERLMENIKNRVVDESEKLRSYGMLLYNYSKMLGDMKRYEEELTVAEEGIELSVNNQQLLNLPGLYINKGSAVYHMYKSIEESIPYYAMAYYGSAIVNNGGNRKNVADVVKKEMGVEFD